MDILVSPSLLSADFTQLSREIKMLNTSDADWLHVDVMDGVFVPNITFGMPIVGQIAKIAQKPLDVHLMIVNPDRYIRAFKDAGADILTVHYEACTHLNRTVAMIKEQGMQAGVSLNPHTPVACLRDIIHELDLVLIMSVNPGFGGQSFIENTYHKLRELRELIQETNSRILVEVDGGVSSQNAKKLAEAGANVLVSGSYIFKSESPEKAIRQLKCF